MRTFTTLTSALAAVAAVSAQTFTDCDPTKKDCPNNPGLNQADYTVDFSKGLPKDWTATSGSIDATGDGGRFRIAKIGDGPTVQSNWHFFYGKVEAKIRAAPGAGIVSSMVFQSSDLDEVDWEWIGSETTRAQSNYFGKGNTTTYDRGGFHNVATPAATFHTYGIDWTKDRIIWSIDGAPVRTLNYGDANGGRTYPQTPMNIRLGNWIGGSPGNSPGTIEWAGGLADTSKGPFDMYVQSLTLKNYNPATEYKYGDRSGNSASIQVITNGKSASPNGGDSSSTGAGSSSGASGVQNNQYGGSTGSGSQGTSGANGGSGTGSSAPSSVSAIPVSVVPTTLVAAPTGGANATVPTGKVQTPTVAVPTPSSSLTLSNGGVAGIQVQKLGLGLLGVCALFLAL